MVCERRGCKGKEGKGKERKGKERKGRERKGKEGKGRERKGKERKKDGKGRKKEGKGRERNGVDGCGRRGCKGVAGNGYREKKPLVMSELGCADGCGRAMGAEKYADGCAHLRTAWVQGSGWKWV